jgi:hypothetical protein
VLGSSVHSRFVKTRLLFIWQYFELGGSFWAAGFVTGFLDPPLNRLVGSPHRRYVRLGSISNACAAHGRDPGGADAAVPDTICSLQSVTSSVLPVLPAGSTSATAVATETSRAPLRGNAGDLKSDMWVRSCVSMI